MDGRSRRPRANMHDVARLAGVSQSTVSLVVNDVPGVATETRARVNRAIEELGFRANRTARNLRGASSKTIGFVTDQMATSPFAGRTILGAQEVAWAHGYVLLIVDAGDSAELTDSALSVLVDQDVSGIIYASMTPKQIAIPAVLRDVPSIIVNAYPVGVEEFPRVDSGDYDGGVLAARTLLTAGHRRILHLAGNIENPSTTDREAGFRSVLARLPVGTIELEVVYGAYEINSGYARMRAVIDNGGWWPTAVFAGCDRVALGVIQALSESGQKVPKDMSLLGYDDQPFLAAHVHPALTTITLPHLEMGKLAVNALLERPGFRPRPGVLVAHPELVVRESIRSIGPPIVPGSISGADAPPHADRPDGQ
jgi:LacI family transcriptional regulator, galactose operon repressor